MGQTQQGIARLDDHNAKKDFWNKALLFLSDDIQSFSLDNVSALEKYAIEQATASKRYSVENKVDPRYVIDRYQRLREELLASGDLVRRQDGGGMLMKTVSFSTPSGAADFVLGGSNNGWIEWKDGDKQTLDALYRK